MNILCKELKSGIGNLLLFLPLKKIYASVFIQVQSSSWSFPCVRSDKIIWQLCHKKHEYTLIYTGDAVSKTAEHLDKKQEPIITEKRLVETKI